MNQPASFTAAEDVLPRRPHVRRRGFWLTLITAVAVIGGVVLSVEPATRRVWALSAAAAGYGALELWDDELWDDKDDLAPAILPLDEAALAAEIAAAWPGGAGVTVELDQPSTVQPLPFRHENTNHPAFQAFASDLKATLGGTIPADPFVLCDAIRQLAPHGIPTDDPGPDPGPCLIAAAGDGPLLCQHFAALTAHALLAVGYDARVLGTSAAGTAFEHAVLEFYEPQARRWILLDPDFNLAYRRVAEWPSADAGAWLSARELHVAAVGLTARGLDARDAEVVRREAGIEAVVLGDAGAPLRTSHVRGGREEAGRRSLVGLFRGVFYAARNDDLTADYPPGHPAAVRQYVLWDGPADALPPICPEGTRLTAAAIDRLYAPARGVWCAGGEFSTRPEPASSAGLHLVLQWRTRRHALDRLTAADARDPLTIDAEGILAWRLSPGENRLTVRSSDDLDQPVSSSTLRISVRPAPVSSLAFDAPQDAP